MTFPKWGDWELMKASRETEAWKRGSVCFPALRSFYNSPWVHGGWLLHGCPRRLVTKKNLMCACLHQGPQAVRTVWEGDLRLWRVTFTGSRFTEGTVSGTALLLSPSVARVRLQCSLDSVDAACEVKPACTWFCPLMLTRTSCVHNKVLYIELLDKCVSDI